MMKKYLPIGTVVLLKNGSKKIMIYGRKQLAEDTGEEFDYVACLYPEGNIDDDYTFLFNHENINEIVFTGYADAEEDEFQKVLNA